MFGFSVYQHFVLNTYLIIIGWPISECAYNVNLMEQENMAYLLDTFIKVNSALPKRFQTEKKSTI